MWQLEMHELSGKSGPDFHAGHPKLTVQSHPKTAVSSRDTPQFFDATNIVLHLAGFVLLPACIVVNQESNNIGNVSYPNTRIVSRHASDSRLSRRLVYRCVPDRWLSIKG